MSLSKSLNEWKKRVGDKGEEGKKRHKKKPWALKTLSFGGRSLAMKAKK